MDDLKNLLNRFRKSLDRDVETREEVFSAIREVLGFEVRLADISVKGTTLYIKTSPPKRSEIALHKNRILEEVRKRTGLRLEEIAY